MNINNFTKVIKSLAEDLRLPAPTQTGTQFELITASGLNLVLDLVVPDTLLISFSQNCLQKGTTEFLWNILQGNLIDDQHPAIINSDSYTNNLIISWMAIGLSDNDRHAVLSHAERFVGYVEYLYRWVRNFISNPVVSTREDLVKIIASEGVSRINKMV
ncbi:hypothetical protein QCD83_25960 [Pseudomonas savastanoi pv. phaseolicola]|uniref:HrpL-regulated protein n=5 Tax=Pseudomonas savastanoi TaxID=29438 RepID=Q5DI77_PSESH|nr:MULTISPECIES: hypothetical protein [Pseudomonas]AAX12113.1 HrpL-regulated protein [Pseudomonas savastanoi pv. phaseolicola]ABG33843.1 HrpL-regulated protein [Pseudomonas savastanoi pv. phaseolicola 1448A]EFW77915.1 HrpL-regulated protein [Pseudomonas savastanoi pv. glycinea str. B076]EFW87510.1 HrpL-regulated protein [Pseudomonas savastanoi pv. glycinea str. race 4]EGH19690.1 HrpL-regulated protein [Pseudomonas savastanoi pv. glycinea str. race 4]